MLLLIHLCVINILLLLFMDTSFAQANSGGSSGGGGGGGGENACELFNPCRNMADCLRRDDNPSRVRCVCKRGFAGNLCEIWPKQCNSEFCLNGGTCVIIKRLPRCLCQPDYRGLFCENYTMPSREEFSRYHQSIFLNNNRFQLPPNDSAAPQPLPFLQAMPPGANFYPPFFVPSNYYQQQPSSSSSHHRHHNSPFPSFMPPPPPPSPPSMSMPMPMPMRPQQIQSQYQMFQPELPPPPPQPQQIATTYQTPMSYPSASAPSPATTTRNTICDFQPCLNYGNCLPITETNAAFKFRCICPEFYSGILCESYYGPPPPAIQLQQPIQQFQQQQQQQQEFPPFNIFVDITTPSSNSMNTNNQEASLPRPIVDVDTNTPAPSTPPTTRTTASSTTTTTTPTTSTARSTSTTARPTTTKSTAATTTASSTMTPFYTTSSAYLRTTANNNVLRQTADYLTSSYHRFRKYSLCNQLRPCANNGQCIDNDKSGESVQKFKCICRPEFTGVFCHIKIRTRSNVCAYNLCLNSGECVPSKDNNSFSCSCPPNFTGKFCELNMY